MIPIIVCVLISAVLFFVLKRSQPKGLPPGPRPWLIIGNLHLLAPSPHLALQKLAKQYGPIYRFDFGMNKAIILNDAKLIREAFNLKEISGRQYNEAITLIMGDTNGFIQGQGDKLVERRRFTLRHLREFGFGKSTMEEYILEEVNEFIDWVKRQNGKPIELQARFNLAVINSLWRIVSGERYNHDDERLSIIVEELEATIKSITKLDKWSVLIFHFSKVAKYFPNLSGWNLLAGLSKGRLQMFQKIITDHHITLPEDNARDFIDVYLQEVKNSTEPDSAFHISNKPDEALLSMIADLFVAGSDTISVTLNWTMLYLLHHPNVQEKLFNEINSVVGKSRAVGLADRKSLPYAEATMMEILRFSSIAMAGVAHYTLEDVQLNGYFIPKGYQVYSNLYTVHHDTEVWSDPEKFRPERFLSPDGNIIQKQEAFLPFSVGKRVCLGETLARDTVFLFLTLTVQTFKLEFDQNNPKPTTDVEGGMLLLPHPYTIVMNERL